MVKSTEVDVGKELAGEVANGESFAALDWGQQAVAGKVFDALALVVAAVNDAIAQLESIWAFDLTP